MAIKRISHIAIAVNDIEAQIRYYRDVLGLDLVGRETVVDQGVEVAILAVGESRIELLQPIEADSPVGRFLKTRGEGLHHVAFAVDDIAQTLDDIDQQGVRLVDRKAKPGAHGAMIAFAHPKSTGGVLMEFCQEQ